MPSQSRTKQPSRGAKQPVRGAKTNTKTNRRAPVKSSTDVPILAVVVGGILVVLFIALLIWGFKNSQTTGIPVVQGSSGSMPCDNLEHTQIHYHSAIQILDQGTLHPIPGGIGIQGGETTPTCFFWLHVHSANQNVIHIESPADRVFTLGDFFKVWDAYNTSNGLPHERLDATHVSTLTIGPDQTLAVYVDLGDGKGPQLLDGDPSKIVLKNHEVITIEIGPPLYDPKNGHFPQFTWPQGL